jgi:hypothetical protein
MRNTITIRRWRIDLYQHAIYIQKQANPKCTDCHGAGHVEVGGPLNHPDAEYGPCACWDPWGGVRIPLIRRTPITERYPF